MEIKVFKDISKREVTFAGLTIPQWIFVIGLFFYVGIDILNSLYLILPIGILRIMLFPILGILACNAMYQPHGIKYSTWLKLYFKFQITTQVRTYQKEGEGMKKYVSNDFKADKNFNEAKVYIR